MNNNIIGSHYEEKSMTLKIEHYIRDYQNGKIKIPDHQRKNNVWPDDRRREFVDDMVYGNKTFIPGAIILYKINKSGDFYINDGLQRTTLLLDVYNNPEKFSLNRLQVDDLFGNIEVTIQRFNYSSHFEAAILFRKVNSSGTMLTDLELYKYFLIYANREIYNYIHKEIYADMKSCDDSVSKAPNEKSKVYSRSIRDIYCNLYRFLTKDKSPRREVYDNITSKTQKNKIIEEELSKEIKKMTLEEFEKKAKCFCDILHRAKALIKTCLNELDQKDNDSRNLTIGMWRSFVCFYIYCINNNISKNDMYEAFKKLLNLTKGKNKTAFLENGNIRQVRFGFQRFNDVITFLPNYEKRKKRNTSNIPRGYDISHKKPFSKYGEGDVFIEPSIINRSRGNKETLFND